MLHRCLVLYAAALGTLMLGQSAAAAPVLLDHEEQAAGHYLINLLDDDVPLVPIDWFANRVRAADVATSSVADGFLVADAASNPWEYLRRRLEQDDAGSQSVVADVIAAGGHGSGYPVVVAVLGSLPGPSHPSPGSTNSNRHGPAGGNAKPGSSNGAHGSSGLSNGGHSSAPISTPEPSTGLLIIVAGVVGVTVRRLRTAK